jgi:hypothetical protein
MINSFLPMEALNDSLKNRLLNRIENFFLHAILAMLQCCEVELFLGEGSSGPCRIYLKCAFVVNL